MTMSFTFLWHSLNKHISLLHRSIHWNINSQKIHLVCDTRNPFAVALHSTEALMAGFLKSTDLGPHPHSYGGPHHPHHSHGPPLPPGMPMSSLAPFGLPHGLDAVGFPHQGMWGMILFPNFSAKFILYWYLYIYYF